MCVSGKHWTSVFLTFLIGYFKLANGNDRSLCPDLVQQSRYHVATFNRTCYLFVNKEKYWDDARDDCWQMGGEMLIVPNQETMDFLIRELNSRILGWNKNGVWNGANDVKGTGWEWTTGEKLRYTFWAKGEPGTIFGLGISVENCACMRRSDGWRWHDYSCALYDFKYNYICQFGFMQYRASPTDQLSHTQDRKSLLHLNPGTEATVLGLAVAGVILLAFVIVITFYLYRKHEYQKAEAERPVVRFQTAGYATIMQDVSRNHGNGGQGNGPPSRPVSNLYFDPSEVTRIYEEVNKEMNHGVNSLTTHETSQLLSTGGASNVGNSDDGYISAIPSNASESMSGHCPPSVQPEHGDSEYVEMNGASLDSVAYENPSMNNADAASGHPSKTSANNVGKDVNELKPVNTKAVGSGNNDRQKNDYVEPTACKRGAVPEQNTGIGHVNEGAMEIHMYTNSLELMDSQKGRPLPPVPLNDYEVPLNSC